jgi:PhnB protein
MSINKLSPYLNFNGNAAQAIKLYETALGAKTESIQRFGDVAEIKSAPEDKGRVMHAMLQIGAGVIMISDTMPDMPTDAASHGNTHVCLEFDDATDLQRKFDALAVGGKVTMPVQDTFWGAKFGMLNDAFGIRWMFNCQTKKA